MKRAVIVLVVLSVVASCSGDDSTDPTKTSTTALTSITIESTTPSSTSASTATPTAAPTTSAAPTSAEPDTTPAPTSTAVSTQTDWRAVIETLGQRRQDLYGSPDVNQIGGVCAADSDCANQLNAQLGDLTAKGWHVEGADPFVVVSAQLEDFDGDTPETSAVVTVVAVIQRAATSGHIVDSTGAVVADVEPDTQEGFNAQGRFLLGQAGVVGDEWRIVSQESLTSVPV